MKKILLLSILCINLLFADSDAHQEHNDGVDLSTLTPDISLILDTSFVQRSVSDDEAKNLELPAIAHNVLLSDEHDAHSHTKNNENNGFNLNYAELLISQEIDNLLDVQAIFHFCEDEVAIDELYFDTHFLGYGTKLKAGKFRSDFGYLNKFHHHAYNFSDMPLVYEAFLGSHGLNEKGVQLQVQIPAPFYLMIGAEVLQGENEMMFSNESIDLNATQTISGEDAPSLYVGYIKLSFDIDKTTISTGVSVAYGSSRLNHLDEENPYAFSGESTLYGVEAVLKHKITKSSFVMLQSELLYRKMEGDLYSNLLRVQKSSLVKKQAGFYSELIYAYNSTLKVGARYENIYKNSVSEDGDLQNLPENLTKQSAMVEYSATEHTHFRLQYNHSSAFYNEDLKLQDIDTIILQVNISIGGHKAHNEHQHN